MPKTNYTRKPHEDIASIEKKNVIIIGRVVELKEITIMNSLRMAVFSLQNRAGKAEVVAFPEAYKASGGAIQEGRNVFVHGKGNRGDGTHPLIIASKVATIELLEKLLSIPS